jgi:5,10-methylenetetrahydromethanopterin reductase
MTIEISGRTVGFGFIRDLPTREMVELSCRAEELGYDSVWTVEHNFGRDAITPASAIAYATRRIRIGFAVVPIFTRTPLLLAATFATLDELSNGRLIIGLGSGSRLLIAAQGITYSKPVTALKENVVLIRQLIRDQHADLQGTMVQHHDVELDFKPYREAIPIWLGVTGPRAVETSGEIGDGAVLNAFTSVDYTRRAVDLIHTGMARRADDVDFQISTMVVCIVDDDRHAALDRMRPILALYLARLPDIAQQSGFDPELLERLTREVNETGAEAASRLLSDEMVDHLTVCGPASHLAEQVGRYVEAGVNYPLVVPIDHWAETMKAVAAYAT